MWYVEESSIAKGIRRITAVTGALALQAQATGITLLEESRAIQQQIQRFEATKDNLDDFDAPLAELKFVLIDIIQSSCLQQPSN